jgi:succinate dehydrogenase/fumarate reductase flavoprotein subunit
MEKQKIADIQVNFHNYHTVVIGAGAAGMNSAKKLYEYMEQKGLKEPAKKIAVVTRGLPLGTSRMSGSDKQTYYKMGTSPDVADTPESFAESLTAGGCCHEDLAVVEGIGSLRGFYNLVEAGVPFPHNSMGTYVGYKTDHDPYERATSAGPRTSKFMSECLERIVRKYGIEIFDGREAVEFIKEGSGDNERITGVITLRKKESGDSGLVLLNLTDFYTGF